MRLLCLILLLPMLFLGCGAQPEHEASDVSALVFNNAYGKWPNPRLVPVCIVNRGDVGDGLFNDVVRHVKREYASRAGIGLVGFNPCAAEDYQKPVIRVFFARVHDWYTTGVLWAGGGLSMLGRYPYGCSDNCNGGTMRLDIGRNGDYPQPGGGWITDMTRATAVHEFGHALGLSHEHERTDAYGCDASTKKTPHGGDHIYIGPYDPNSIMNYCHSQGITGLSNGDVDGLQWLYPITKDLGNSVAIRMEASGKCLDIPEFSFDPSARIQQWDCNPGQRNQLWRVRDVGGGLFEIRSSSTDLCLDVENESRNNGAKIVQWFCRGSDNQKVRILDRGNGRKSFQFVHSGKCLDLDNGRPDNGIQLQQWDCLGNPAQSFYH